MMKKHLNGPALYIYMLISRDIHTHTPYTVHCNKLLNYPLIRRGSYHLVVGILECNHTLDLEISAIKSK